MGAGQTSRAIVQGFGQYERGRDEAIGMNNKVQAQLQRLRRSVPPKPLQQVQRARAAKARARVAGAHDERNDPRLKQCVVDVAHHRPPRDNRMRPAQLSSAPRQDEFKRCQDVGHGCLGDSVGGVVLPLDKQAVQLIVAVPE